MKRLLHASLILTAVLPWLLGCMLFGAALLLTMTAHRLIPDSQHGNCWSYVGPRWARQGGYVAVRLAAFPRIFRWRFVPHAIWLKSMPFGADTEQTEPVRRTRRLSGVWRTLYFKFRIVKESK